MPTLSETIAEIESLASWNTMPFPVTKKKKASLDVPPIQKETDLQPLSAKNGFTFGCDPEVFIKDDKGRHVPPIGIIPGTKEEPADMGDGVQLQIDGMAAEFNITPATNFEEFNNRIETALAKIKDLLPKKWAIDIVPYVRFDAEIFDEAPPQAKELGCHPDINAWTGEVNPPPSLEYDPRLRTAAGHLHVGWTKDADLTDPQHIINCRDLVQQMDWFIGGWSISKDPDNTRRQLYGKAGACRYKPYGVEYRVPSNFWIKNKETRLLVWNRMQSAISAMSKIFLPEKAAFYSKYLEDSINAGAIHPELVRDGVYPIYSLDQRVSRL